MIWPTVNELSQLKTFSKVFKVCYVHCYAVFSCREYNIYIFSFFCVIEKSFLSAYGHRIGIIPRFNPNIACNVHTGTESILFHGLFLVRIRV